MKRLAAAILLVLSILILPALAEETYYIQGEGHFGCIDKDDYVKMAAEEDPAAFEQALNESLLAGTSTTFEDGEPVYLEGSEILSELVQLRRPDETTAYWTTMDAIETEEYYF